MDSNNSQQENVIQSMTGFARVEANHESEGGNYAIAIECRSLNNKALDLKCRYPNWLEDFELETKKIVSAKLSRGSLGINLQIKKEAAQTSLVVDEDILEQTLAAAKIISSKVDCEAPRLDGLLNIKGMLKYEEAKETPEEREKLLVTLRSTLNDALDVLVEARKAEGKEVKIAIEGQLTEISNLLAEAERQAKDLPAMIKKKLEDQVASLVSENVDPDRIAQEVTMLAVKADVREELDRLKVHIKAGYDLLEDGAVIGRRFDFLVQEFNRVTNTLCSKAQAMDLKKTGLAMKAVIDQLREQIQNIE